VHEIAKRWDVVPKPWTDGVFEASSTTIESLMALTQEADFALLVLTADDVTTSRGKRKPSPRDNVVFELGLLMGALGRGRVFTLKPTNVDIRIPTDLLGVTWLEYRRGGPGGLRTKLAAPCGKIKKRISTIGPK
jgi:predicted nucleotide-binding protein